jgi:4-amino-4-deoxy-L-arabinose transferase-like glycosyltransferase
LGNGAIALLLACVTAVLLVVTAPDIGLTWDEPAYIAGARGRAGWFQDLIRRPGHAFGPAGIGQYWSTTHEHPGLDMAWSGLAWSLSRGFLDDLTAHRLGNMLLAAALVALLYLMVAETYGRPAGLFAAAALLSMPRFFFHAHLAALDVPVAVAIFAVTFLFWRTVDRPGWWWGLVWGAAWGAAVAVKLNAVFLPAALIVWFLIFRRKWGVALRLFLMGLSGFPAFLAAWPWLYHYTWGRIQEYMDFHLDHFKIGQWYFGQFYLPPPWHFVFVMTWAVVPLTILLLAFAGMGRARLGRQDRGLGWLLILGALGALAPFVYEKNLLYDNERLFMALFPFLAALAGAGFGWALDGLRSLVGRLRRPALAAPAGIVLGLVLLAPQSLAAARLYPHLLSYYSEGVGGLPGAARLGLETTYWCETYAEALPYINAQAQPGDRIWAAPWSHDVLIYYQTQGRLRADLRILAPYPGLRSILGSQAPGPVEGDHTSADWLIFQYRQSQYGEAGEEYEVLRYLEGLAPPVLEVSRQDIPLMQLYQR